MPTKIESRLAKLELETNQLRYQNGYSAIMTVKDDGSRWYSDDQGNLISEEDADPDLIPQTRVIIMDY